MQPRRHEGRTKKIGVSSWSSWLRGQGCGGPPCVAESEQATMLNKISRRAALQLVGAAPAAAALVWTPAEAAQAHTHAQQARAAAAKQSKPYKPKFFTAHEYAMVAVLVDLIIPKDERSGGATDAGVPEFMDFMLIDQPRRQVAMRGGLALIDRMCEELFAKRFVACSDEQRRHILDQIAYTDDVPPARTQAVAFFPLLQLIVIVAVDRLRLEVSVASTTSLYFSSGTGEAIVPVESTLLLPILFVVVALLFVTVAQRMARELEAAIQDRAGGPAGRPLRAYALNLAGSLAGVAAFALMSWLQVPPVAWFGIAFISALRFILERRRPIAWANLALLAAAVALVWRMGNASLWSPYYRINVVENGAETVVAVNNVFHQSMAPLDEKEYFYQWPYTVCGDTFDNVLVLGAGSGTDVAAALRHGAKHVDAVEIDPVILRLGAEHHPDHPYADPRVRTINDDARHFLATTDKKYDLIVFALIDSLTVQSSFASVRLESYMFTEESFRAVRDRLKPRGAMALYNYFREKWLVDRLANTAAAVFGRDPLAYVHQERAYLAVVLAGPRLHDITTFPAPPTRVLAYRQPHTASPARLLQRDASVVPATDDWPFLYMRKPGLPQHYAIALAIVLTISAAAVWWVRRSAREAPRMPARSPVVSAVSRGPAGVNPAASPAAMDSDYAASAAEMEQRQTFPWHFFLLGAGFMLLETKSIVQFALRWGSTWSSASLAIASVLMMAVASAVGASLMRFGLRAPIALPLLALIAR